MPDHRALVLEVMRQQDQLKMCLFSFKDFASTVRHYTQSRFATAEVESACKEIAAVLHKASVSCGEPRRPLAVSLRRNCQFLWEQLVSRQVKEKLLAAAAEDLLLLVDEELVNIPWELLFDGKQFLCLRFNLGRLLRAAYQSPQPVFRSRPAVPERVKMLVMADPTSDLESSYREGLAIKNMFAHARQPLVVDFKSTHIDAVFAKQHLRDYDIVHFAGHCRYDPVHPEKTGWELSDSRLTTEDILTLGENAVLPSLVFSNACQSARVAKEVADIDYREKNYSLASAFLFSGVRHYIGTSRKVEDHTSLEFARSFYARVGKGISIGEAVRCARKDLIEKHGADSLCWTSYLLYGDPTFAFFGAGQDKSQQARAAGISAGVFAPGIAYLRSVTLKKRVLCTAALASAGCILLLAVMLPSLRPHAYWRFREAKTFSTHGENERAVEAVQKIIGQDKKFLAAYKLLAESYERQGMRAQALQAYFDYAFYSTQDNKKKNVAFAYSMIAWLYQTEGEYTKAFEYYQKALAVSRDSHDRLHEAVALRKLAVWHMDREENDRALELLTKSSEINRERQWLPEHRYNLACDYFDMGLVFANKKDNEAAKAFYRKSMVLFRRINKKEELSDYYFNLGEMAVSEKEYHEALANYMRGLRIDQAQANRPSIAVDYLMIGELYEEMDNFDKAEDYFKKAERECRAIGIKPELGEACYALGSLYQRKGLKHKAREYLRFAQEIFRDKEFPQYPAVKSAIDSLNQ